MTLQFCEANADQSAPLLPGPGFDSRHGQQFDKQGEKILHH